MALIATRHFALYTFTLTLVLFGTPAWTLDSLRRIWLTPCRFLCESSSQPL